MRLGAGTIDLVHQQDIGEQRPAPEYELVLRRIEDVGADDVGGHQIRGALHAFELTAEDPRQSLGQQRLAETRGLHPRRRR